MATSKHTLANPGAWLSALAIRLKESGHLCLVLPYESSFEWIKAANEFGLYCQHRLEVFSFQDDPQPIRCLIHFQGELCRPEIRRMNIYKQNGSYSDEYFRFSGIQHSK
jgi:tRNA1(Val) A37 N6-methylase TrmN6